MSKRSFSRLPFTHPVHVNSSDSLYRGIIENVSHGGMFIKSNTCLSKGETVLVKIDYRKGQSKISIEFPGQIVRKSPQGVGIKSTHIDSHMIIQLKEIIASSQDTGEPLLVDVIGCIDHQQATAPRIVKRSTSAT
jgi:Tfp pilus assembly protein PilZ